MVFSLKTSEIIIIHFHQKTEGHKIKAEPCISSIPQGIAYHQNAVLHIIKPTEIHTWRCDEIQHGKAVLMIYTLTRDDIPSLSAWIKKSDKSKLVGFFGCGTRIRTQTNRVRVCCATLTQFGKIINLNQVPI